jgi:hypothetical protein
VWLTGLITTPTLAEDTLTRKTQAIDAVRGKFAGRDYAEMTRSIPRGSSDRALTVLARALGRNRAAVPMIDRNDGEREARGNDFVCVASADGTRGRMSIRPATRLERPVAQRMPHGELEARALDFVSRELSELIPLGAGEALVAETVSYEMVGGSGPNGENAYQAWSGSRVVLVRTIDGTPVLGGGSRVIVGFDVEGQPDSVDYDWPSLVRSPKRIRPVAQGVLLGRVRQKTLERVPGAVPTATPLRVSESGDPFAGLMLDASTRLVTLRCGYLDSPAVRATRTDGKLPLGCVSHAESWSGPTNERTRVAVSSEVDAE